MFGGWYGQDNLATLYAQALQGGPMSGGGGGGAPGVCFRCGEV